MDYTQSLGNTTELQCITAFIQLGYQVSIPYGNGAKYDFIADVDGELLKVQCKTSHMLRDHGKDDPGAFSFSTCTQTTNTKKTSRFTYSKSDVDYFMTVYNNEFYIVPVSECSTHKTLRFTPPKNNQKSYNKAEDYLLSKRFKKSQQLIDSQIAFLNRNNN